MVKLGLVCCVWVLALSSCVADSTDTTGPRGDIATSSTEGLEPTDTTVLSAGDGPVVIAETPHWDAPLLDVAVRPDGLPVVVFHDVTRGVLEIRRCIDPGCSATVPGAAIQTPADMQLLDASLSVGPSGLPVVVGEGATVVIDEYGETVGPPAVWIVACDDEDCKGYRESRFDGETQPEAAFATDGTFVLATTHFFVEDGSGEEPLSPDDREQASTFLRMRFCEDPMCEKQQSTTDIPVLLAQRVKSLLLDPDGVPSVVFGNDAHIHQSEGGSAVVAFVCTDATCTSASVTDGAEILDQDAGPFPAVFNPVGRVSLAYTAVGVGLRMLTWDEDGIVESTLIDEIGLSDNVQMGDVAVGQDGLPAVLYMRISDHATESESAQIVLAKCRDESCRQGVHQWVVAEETADLYLHARPRMTLDPDGLPVIAYRTCPTGTGCKPNHINLCIAQGCVTGNFDPWWTQPQND